MMPRTTLLRCCQSLLVPMQHPTQLPTLFPAKELVCVTGIACLSLVLLSPVVQCLDMPTGYPVLPKLRRIPENGIKRLQMGKIAILLLPPQIQRFPIPEINPSNMFRWYTRLKTKESQEPKIWAKPLHCS